jgi:hypothetical protein
VKSRDFSPDPRTGVKISAFPAPLEDRKLTLSSRDLPNQRGIVATIPARECISLVCLHIARREEYKQIAEASEILDPDLIARRRSSFTQAAFIRGNRWRRCLTFSSDLVPISPGHGVIWYLSSCNERGPEFRRRQLHKRK